MKQALWILILVLTLGIWGCGGGSGTAVKSITIKGSDTMVILGQRWAETYMKEHPEQANPGYRRRVRYRDCRFDQRRDRHLRSLQAHEG